VKDGATLLDVLDDAADNERLALLVVGVNLARGTEELAEVVKLGSMLDEVIGAELESNVLEDSEIEAVLENCELDDEAVWLAFAGAEKTDDGISELELRLEEPDSLLGDTAADEITVDETETSLRTEEGGVLGAIRESDRPVVKLLKVLDMLIVGGGNFSIRPPHTAALL
jgi:hypothetical protein